MNTDRSRSTTILAGMPASVLAAQVVGSSRWMVTSARPRVGSATWMKETRPSRALTVPGGMFSPALEIWRTSSFGLFPLTMW
ncbi:MAG: hypothetical protein M1379_08205 [Firmicutes bacterium]|nr:hypothetical protein [Bacillota bacterium]